VADRDALILVSTNPNKAIEAERILGLPLLRVSISLPEIQAVGVEEITRYKLDVARTKGYHRLIVEDGSLGFDELGNFPGPYVKWLLEAAGGKGLAAIAYALNNRAAKAQCCVAYWDGVQGHIFHGELALDQLFFQRPAPHYSDYRSPIRGLYQCGSSTHPGGGVSGIPGHNAAREILRDWRTLGG